MVEEVTLRAILSLLTGVYEDRCSYSEFDEAKLILGTLETREAERRFLKLYPALTPFYWGTYNIRNHGGANYKTLVHHMRLNLSTYEPETRIPIKFLKPGCSWDGLFERAWAE